MQRSTNLILQELLFRRVSMLLTVVALIATIIGYVVGTALGLNVGPTLFPATAKSIVAQPTLAGWAMVATPLLAALASLLPATLASTQDPAVVLRAD